MMVESFGFKEIIDFELLEKIKHKKILIYNPNKTVINREDYITEGQKIFEKKSDAGKLVMNTENSLGYFYHELSFVCFKRDLQLIFFYLQSQGVEISGFLCTDEMKNTFDGMKYHGKDVFFLDDLNKLNSDYVLLDVSGENVSFLKTKTDLLVYALCKYTEIILYSNSKNYIDYCRNLFDKFNVKITNVCVPDKYFDELKNYNDSVITPEVLRSQHYDNLVVINVDRNRGEDARQAAENLMKNNFAADCRTFNFKDFQRVYEVNFRIDSPDKPTYYILRYPDMHIGIVGIAMQFLPLIPYALSKGMIPVVDMQNYSSAYLDDEKFGKENAWEYYFEQPLRIGLEEAYNGSNVVLSEVIDYLHYKNNIFPNHSLRDMDLYENKDGMLTEWRTLKKMGLFKIKEEMFKQSDKRPLFTEETTRKILKNIDERKSFSNV